MGECPLQPVSPVFYFQLDGKKVFIPSIMIDTRVTEFMS